ncbi:MAG: energy transducer TonB [Verrucomicrobiales bacterium]|nr:energy transducer TonB [Verrucomicrobiales bacterium]MCP5526782.1 energy transducer TonB [Verrucomicrobiales bacterium]
MRRIYTPPAPRSDLPFALGGAALLTLAVFLVLPLTQMVSSKVQRLKTLTTVDTAELREDPREEEPPPPPPEPEPPPEPPPPTLADTPQSMNLNVSLDVAFGSGGAYAGAMPSELVGGGAQGAGLAAFDVAELEKRPELIAAVSPVYPAALRKAGVEGSVSVVFVLDEAGHVEDPRVERSSRTEFEKPALDALRKWRFRPGMKDGQPVRTFMRQPIRFTLSG